MLSLFLFAAYFADAQVYTFTNAGATAQNGPTQTAVNTAYNATTLAGKVTVIGNGIQEWIVPKTGLYKLNITGAQGASGTAGAGGLGARMQGEFYLIAGQKIRIIVGQIGTTGGTTGAGGGGTFVVDVNGNKPLIIAGGGGGSSSDQRGSDASTSASGNNSSIGVSLGGTAGAGGKACTSGLHSGGGGGGYSGDGVNGSAGFSTSGGKSFVNGGVGGQGDGHAASGFGGFGGGGGGCSSTVGAGGGGGYSGGAGGQHLNECVTGAREGGGGGGSYNSGNNQTNTAGVQSGNGTCVITLITPLGSPNDAGIYSIDQPNIYCQGTHNVVVTLQNYGTKKLDSVTINWSVNGSVQTPYYFSGPALDTFGGSNPTTKQVTLGSYSFSNAAFLIKAWTSKPNGLSDTIIINDSAKATVQSGIPKPTLLKADTVNAYDAYLTWKGGATNTWLYVIVLKGNPVTGKGTYAGGMNAKVTGLNPTTDYDFYVREVCSAGDTSAWAGPLTFKTPCATVLGGTYTIDRSIAPSATNFISFAAASSALKQCGIKAPVTFNVKAGTYSQDRIDLTAITGASAINTVTFKGAGIGSTVLSYNAASTADWATIMLNGTDYVTIEDMTVIAQSTANGHGIYLSGTADYNKFNNIRVEVNPTGTGTGNCGVVLSGSPTVVNSAGMSANYNKFTNMYIKGGYYGITMQGTSTASYITGNEISNSYFTDQYYSGIYTYYTQRTIITYNKIENLRNTTGCYAMMIYYTNPDIIGNTVTSPYVSLYLYYANYYLYQNIRSKIHNNILYGTATNTYNCYMANDYYLDFYHNTCVGNYISSGTFYVTGALQWDCRNNVFVNQQSAAAAYSVYFTGSTFTQLDYNQYFTAGGTLIYHNAAINTLATYKSVFPQFNMNSVNSLPKFIGAPNFHVNSQDPPFSGAGLGVPKDVDGHTRCSFAPTVGADESKFPYPTPILSIGVLDSAFENSLTRIVNTYSTTYGEKVNISWYINGIYENSTKDLDYSFPTTGLYTVSIKVENCAGYDSVGKIITVYAPTRTPITDFVASNTTPNLFDLINLRDLSKHGATKWLWSATPADGVIFEDETMANPYALFIYPGLYDMCLTTENAFGQGTTLCKKTYISVRDEVEMCSGIEESTSPTGRITDDGGLVGAYKPNRNCSFLINTCGKVNVVFSDFLLADQQDELRIYDGADAKGTLLGAFPGGQPGLPGGATGLTAVSGKMYFEWITGSSGEAPGFEAYWITIPDTSIKNPTANFSVPTPLYTKNGGIFKSTSLGKNLTYSWDFVPPTKKAGFEGGKKDFDRYSWPASGTYDVKLKVSNCVGIDEITKQVTVIDPTAPPVVNFYADRVRVPVLGKVRLFDSSDQGPNQWKWSVSTPNKVRFETPDSLQTPTIYFTAPGFYDVKLVATNSFGTDSLIKSTFIEVFTYCTPSVGVMNSDMGISRVKFGTIDNYTNSGVTAYSNYFETYAAEKIVKKTTFSVIVERPTNMQDEQSRKIWIDWNGDADFDDAGEEVAYEQSTKTKSYTANVFVPSSATAGTTVMRVGTGYKADPNQVCGVNSSGEYEDYPLNITEDDVKPSIVKKGSDTVYVEQWHKFVESGYSAFDNVDGNISTKVVRTTNFDSTTVGTYSAWYNVKDVAGNNADQYIRTIIVTPDITAPKITLIGNNPDKLTINTSYQDPGAKAIDYSVRDISGSISTSDDIVNTVLGDYFVYYVVDDGSGNRDSVARAIKVVDDVAPVISLTGSDTMYVDVHSDYNEPGFSSNDNYYATGTLVNKVDSANFDKHKTGLYYIAYTSEDGSQNIGNLKRWIVVRDLQLPVITLVGNDTIEVNVYSTYADPGATISDNYCTNNNYKVDNYPNTSVLGEYILNFNTTDCEGNKAIPVSRVVKVVDRGAPVIELIGFATENVYRWGTYIDKGVTIADNYYAESILQPLVAKTSNLDLLWPGIYEICYQVTDPSGNKSNKICRTVNVKQQTNGVQNEFASLIKLYPNPNSGIFTVSMEGGFATATDIKVTDVLGKTVATHTIVAGQNQTLIDMSSVAAGVYTVQVKQGEQTAVIKITVTH